MPLAEILITTVAPTIAKTILKLWIGDEKLAAEGGAGAIDMLAKLVPDLRARNEARRQLDAIGEKAAESLDFIFETEGKTLLVDDQEAVAKLVAETLDRTRISAELLVRQDLDPERLAAHFLSEAHERLAQLPQPRVELYRRVIEEASQSIVDMAHQLPNFTERTSAELLRGNRVLLDAADRTLEALERIRSQTPVDQEAESVKFETDYRRAVGRNLNRMELFGVDLAHSSKFHPLSVAYVSLEVGRPAKTTDEGEEESVIHSVETALAEDRRILIKGPAGAGKTTLVRWIAVQAASGAFENPLKEWNDAIPFVIRLRQFSTSPFPPPEDFPGLIASTVAGTMPQGWVHQKLASGNAVVMVDGVDEVAEARRDEVRTWVKELTDTFPGARLIVTSRPHAVEEGWLEADGFGEADLQPMATSGIENFIDHWHKAVAEEVQQEQEAAGLANLAKNLKETLRSNRAIRRLATSPLLCGVICALHRDTNEQLPGDRIELYERCCSMLLERRDPESGLALTGYPRLTYRQKRALLDDLAYWMIKNESTEVSIGSASERLGRKLDNLRVPTTEVASTPENVLRFFVERSGMLRVPLEDKLDFAHRTFQEFMAAQAAVDEDDIGLLVKNASNPQWREVIILGAGLARPSERRELITSLLEKGDKDEKARYQLHLMAAACMETAVDLDSEVKVEVENRLQKLVPPAGMYEAALLADAAGEIAVPFLKRGRRLSAPKVAACVRALGLIGSLEALQAVGEYANDDRVTVLREVARCADRFDLDSYRHLVLPRLDLSKLPDDAVGRVLIKFGVQELKGLGSVAAVELSNPSADTLLNLYQLHALRSLRLSGVGVDDLSRLRGLGNLEVLWLRGTRITDLAALRDLPNLKILDLEIPAGLLDITPLQALTKLRQLALTTIHTKDLGPIAGLTNLASLSLNGSGVKDLSPFQGLPDLRSLQLSYTAVSDLSPLRSFPNLQWLTLSGFHVKDISALEGCRHLQSLSLFGTTVVDLSPLRSLSNLRTLGLSGSGVIDLAPLQSLANLQSLELWSFTANDLSPLRDHSKLLWLDVRYAKVPAEQLESLAAANPQVKIRR